MLLSAASVSPQGVWTVTEVFFDTFAKPLLINARELDGGTVQHHACGSCSLQTSALPMLAVLLLAWELSFAAQSVLKMGRKIHWTCTAVPLLLRASKGYSLDSRLVLKLRLILTGAIAKTTENFLYDAFNLQHLLFFRVQKKAVPRCRIHLFPLLKLKENGLKGLNYGGIRLVSFLLDLGSERGLLTTYSLPLCFKNISKRKQKINTEQGAAECS